MEKIKSQIKNIIYTTGFLFRPITPVAFSFTLLLISSALLIFIIFNLDESTKAYQVLLAILTGITASLLIAIMMELYNNYRFNVKRQRELRKFFTTVASYEINIDSIIKSNTKYASGLGSGRACAVFCHLNKIIPSLREVLNKREYLYQAEIEEIDNILCEYNDVVKIIWTGLLTTFMGLVADEAPEYLEYLIEKAIFLDRNVFEGYFEVIDTRYELVKGKTKDPENEPADYNNKYEFQSDMISLACGNIDKSMTKIQRRVKKEPYFCVIASYKERNR
ncbi:MAG: hypothetical protein PWR27_2280 [Petroclostridium sp.]|jgi:hypothetical protein|nr:hypothetical protein [Petroclostridium sp.]